MYWMRNTLTEFSPLMKNAWNWQAFQQRFLSSSEVSVALRPFYFAVHPDLFEQHPQERDINENSLKLLNSYIETILQQKPASSSSRVKFFLRKEKTVDGSFQSVNISLDREKDIRGALQTILSTCSLSTQYVDSLPKTPPARPKQYVKEKYWTTDASWEDNFKTQEGVHHEEEDTLLHWLKRYNKDAEERSRACKPVHDEISRLQEELCNTLKLEGLLWSCGWGISHFRGCLHSLQTLVTHHAEDMSKLEGRTLIFGSESGMSLQGHVILNSGEVRHNWLDLIRNLDRYDLKRIPPLEAILSRSICDVKITQRLFRPQLLADVYESRLSMLATSIAEYRESHSSFPPEWPESLSKFQLVVEGEAGPLMLSPSGQFITPSSCPVSLLFSFISDNLTEARKRMDQYVADLEQEKDLTEQCLRMFELEALGKDDNVTPSQMAACCRQLLKQNDLVRPYLHNSRLWITHYFSLLSDGEMCIPWNWK